MNGSTSAQNNPSLTRSASNSTGDNPRLTLSESNSTGNNSTWARNESNSTLKNPASTRNELSSIRNNQDFINSFTAISLHRNVPNWTLHDTASSNGGRRNFNSQAQGDQTAPTFSFAGTEETGTEKELFEALLRPDPESMDFFKHCSLFLHKWIAQYTMDQNEGRDSDKSFVEFLKELAKYGILRSDELLVKFLRTVVQLTVNPYFNGLMNPEIAKQKPLAYRTVDATSRFVSLLMLHLAKAGGFELSGKLLHQFMIIVIGTLFRENKIFRGNFDQMPFQRLILMFFLDIHPAPSELSKLMVSLLGNTLFHIRPAKLPAFAFSWIEIFGHRDVLKPLLTETPEIYCTLLREVILYLEPSFRLQVLPQPALVFYQGFLRILSLILHDCQDFLSDYAYQLLDVIPSNCVQLRNLVLSAFPKRMFVPDPFSRTLDISTLPGIDTPPDLLYNVGRMVAPCKRALDNYLKHRYPEDFHKKLRTSLMAPKDDANKRYNVPLLNSVVLYCGSLHMVLLRCQQQVLSISKIVNTPHMDIFENLAESLDAEGRYLFLNSLANQLRFPSSHTYYFYLVILHIFQNTPNLFVKEQITRVLVERLVACRPHPWGLIVTTAELMRNPIYDFWSYEFVKNFSFVLDVFNGIENTASLNLRSTAFQKDNKRI